MEKQLVDKAKKFLFDTNDFGEDAVRKKLEAARKPTFSQEEMAASRQTGFEEGRIAGINETLNSQEAHIRDLLQQIVIAASRLEENEGARLGTFIEQSTLLTAQALSKTLPALIEYLSAEQITGFIKTILTEQVRAQSLTIHISPENHDEIKSRLEKVMASMRRKTQCIIESDAGLSAYQCRFEWTGGGAQWDPAKVADAILATLKNHLPAHLAPHAQTLDGADKTTHNEPTSNGDAA